jgi:hypothetical protein
MRVRIAYRRLTVERQSFEYLHILWQCRWIESSISETFTSGVVCIDKDQLLNTGSAETMFVGASQ